MSVIKIMDKNNECICSIGLKGNKPIDYIQCNLSETFENGREKIYEIALEGD